MCGLEDRVDPRGERHVEAAEFLEPRMRTDPARGAGRVWFAIGRSISGAPELLHLDEPGRFVVRNLEDPVFQGVVALDIVIDDKTLAQVQGHELPPRFQIADG